MRLPLLAAAGAISGASLASATPLFYDGAMQFISNANAAVAASSAVASPSSGVTPNNSNGTGSHDHGFNGHTQIYRNCQDSGSFAITFDDGPQNNEPAFVKLLNDANVKATFFVNGMNWRCIYDPDMVASLRATYAAGHQIANHGWGHDHSSELTDAQFTLQLQLVEEALVKILGVMPNMFRPPYGDFDDANIAVLSSRNYSAAVLWDQISGPATGTSVQDSNAMYRRVAGTYPSPHVVLNHEQDTAAITQIIPQAIQQLLSAGYKLVTISECLGVPAYQWVGQPQERDATWTCAGKPGPGQAGL